MKAASDLISERPSFWIQLRNQLIQTLVVGVISWLYMRHLRDSRQTGLPADAQSQNGLGAAGSESSSELDLEFSETGEFDER